MLKSPLSSIGSSYKYQITEYVKMQYLILRHQEKIIDLAIQKAGSERKLAKILGVMKSAVYFYKYKKRTINETVFEKLMTFLQLEEIEIQQIVLKRLDQNWKQVIGGKNCYMSKVKAGTYEKNLAKMKRGSHLMHKKQRRELGEKYFISQIERFKKIGTRKFKSKNGELVRNIWEKKIADKLFDFGIKYEYEPCVTVEEGYYFPDFKINNILIEVTMWRGFDKATKLKEKINNLTKSDYKVFVIVPENLRKFYRSIEKYLISENEIEQTIRPLLMPS
jgi:hypothetical protein